jgi:hypothetical protein
MKNSDSNSFGVGVDCGTGNLVSARSDGGKKVSIKKIRDVFIDLPREHKRMLKMANTAYVEFGDHLFVVGSDALDTANLLNKEVRRPLSKGTVSAGELDAQPIIGLMIKQIAGEPKCENEKCCYSVPAPAIDIHESDITYHSAILGKIFKELGYDAEPVNEALAIVFSECNKENFSGIAISYGAGLTNICLAYNSMSALEFSVGWGGDRIDSSAAKAVNTTAAKICAIKESGVDITAPKNREEEAIALFVQTLIDYTIDSIIKQFVKVKSEILVPKPIPLVISGGTSLIGGFLDVFKTRFQLNQSKFPVQISEIRAAADPMTAVATGLLIYAQTAED